MILPQTALLLINLSYWGLVSGEMSEVQKGVSYSIFGFEVLLLLSGILTIAILQYLKQKVNLLACLLLFMAHIAYLWVITSQLGELLPESVTLWILPPDEVLYYQYILMMPVIFYTGLRLSCCNLLMARSLDVSVSVGVLILVPLFSYLCVTVLSEIFHGFDIPSFFLILLFFVATIITMMAFLRVLTFLYIWLNKFKEGYFVLLLAVGFAGPLGGLALNSVLPFPCDFQSVSVYVLAVINGLILLLCFKEGSKSEVFGWFLRCLMYPFSLYFFLVFLPFLPLSLFAMIAFGSGFLILAPTALFIVHSRKIIDEGKRVTTLLGWKVTLLLFLAGFAVMPAFIVGEALYDRHCLVQAVEVVYSPNYARAKTGIKPESVKRSLLKLREMKDGIILPFISSFYNKLVFNGMVLPDYKMNEMYLMFFGQELPESESPDRFFFSGRMSFRNRGVAMPERNIEITDIAIEKERQGEFVRANISLTLRNKGAIRSEFVSEIELGEGVMVCGYWLNVGEEKVDGHIFEKKAAMWIYHMIRDVTRRDPGLLVYKSDNLLKLSVYPFSRNEQRKTGIELLYPVGMKPFVKIGSKQLAIASNGVAGTKKILLFETGENNTSVLVSGEIYETMPFVQRKPYLHFIVDGSANAPNYFEDFGERMTGIAAEYGHADECMITLANYDFFDLTDGLTGISEIEEIMTNARTLLPSFGGAFCYERAIKQKLLEFKSRSVSDLTTELSVPVFIVIEAPGSKSVSIGDLSSFGCFLPDVEGYYIAKEFGNLVMHKYSGDEDFISTIGLPSPIVLLKCGDSITALAKKAGWFFADFSGGGVPGYYDPNANDFIEINDFRRMKSELRYSQGVSVWRRYREAVYRPCTIDSELGKIVQMSRDCRIMTPLTSYIVLENSAQLEMLRRKEKQGLSSSHALEFDEFMESPTPPVLFLLPVVFAMLFLWKKRSRARACQQVPGKS
jgi:hypothetical protein